ncbi:hypothetical protein D3C73_1311550 [compost metagenome]
MRTPQSRFYSGCNLAQIERLCDIVISAQLQEVNFGANHVLCRNNNDRNIGKCPHFLKYFVAAFVGKHDIQQD